MLEQLTKKHLNDALMGLATTRDIKSLDAKVDAIESRLSTKIESVEHALSARIDSVQRDLTTKTEASEERLAESIRGMNISLTQHLARLEGKLDYIAQNASLRQELRNLVSQLKDQGMKLDESKIFVV